jgi:hypothetical protein
MHFSPGFDPGLVTLKPRPKGKAGRAFRLPNTVKNKARRLCFQGRSLETALVKNKARRLWFQGRSLETAVRTTNNEQRTTNNEQRTTINDQRFFLIFTMPKY